jgi:hypothetical protein
MVNWPCNVTVWTTHLDNLLLRCLALGPVLFLTYLGEEYGDLGINERGDAVGI